MITKLKHITLIFLSSIFVLLLSLCFALLFSGCTISVTTLHTQGTASDVVDENQTSTPTVNASAEIPLVKP